MYVQYIVMNRTPQTWGLNRPDHPSMSGSSVLTTPEEQRRRNSKPRRARAKYVRFIGNLGSTFAIESR